MLYTHPETAGDDTLTLLTRLDVGRMLLGAQRPPLSLPSAQRIRITSAQIKLKVK